MTSVLTCSPLINLYPCLPLESCSFSFVLKKFFDIQRLSLLNTILLTSVLFQLFIFNSHIFLLILSLLRAVPSVRQLVTDH